MLQIFENEILDGLGQSLSNNSIAYSLDLNLLKEEILANTIKWAATASIGQPDLFYMDSILATIGWNLNDDIFLKEEILTAKDTPVDKPFNIMHKQDEIIGHMTASRLLNTNYEIVNDDNFEHIAVTSVIYRAWRDEQKLKEIDITIAQILDGQWKVSMECLFNRFDYGLITPEGRQIIVERTPETSYLTKYLRAYKGPGTVNNNNKIGRVLRNITFCGKGLVNEPGNPYSIIFNQNKKFFGAKASIKELRMNELEIAQQKMLKLEADLSKAEASLEATKTEIQKTAEAKLQTAIAERDELIKTKTDVIAALQADIVKLSDNLAKATANAEAIEIIKTEAMSKYEAVASELTKIKSEASIASRKAALAAVVEADKVANLLAKFSSASDEIFNDLITTLSEFKPFVKKEEDKEEEKAKAQVVADLAKAELEKEIAGHSTASNTDTAFQSVVESLVNSSKYKSL